MEVKFPAEKDRYWTG